MLVYLLTDPRNPLKGYVGQTRLTASRRLGDHLKAAQYGSALPVHRWIRKLQREGVAPRVEVLRVLDSSDECNRVERELIAKYRGRPEMKLYNVTDGGDNGEKGDEWRACHKAAMGTPEARAKRSQLSQAMWDRTTPADRAKRLAKAHTPESRKARSEKMAVRNAEPGRKEYLSEKSAAFWRTPEGRHLASTNSKEVQARPEVKAKLAASTTAAWSDPAHRASRRAAMKAALATPQAQARKADLMRARWADPEYKARVSARSAASQRGVRRTAVAHGTDTEYKKGCHCGACRAAHAQAARVRKVSHR